MKPALLLYSALALSIGCEPPKEMADTSGDTALEAEAPRRVDTVFIEEMTWSEIRAAIDGGKTTLIIPTAGTEQNGPHMVMGKHRYIIEMASDRIARQLGNALVAPTVTYVPEGSVDPPSGHMRYAGSITVPNEVFMDIVEWGARSGAVHGFTNIVLIGDSGGNQRGMEEVANKLNTEWAGGPVRVHFIPDYYSANGFREWVMEEGETEDAIGSHAGILDTSLLLYVNPQHIRKDKLAPLGGGEGSGVSGDPSRASVERGEKGMELRVDAAVRQIQAKIATR